MAPTAPTSPAASSATPQTAPSATNLSGAFSRALSISVTGADVLRLQKLLNSDPATKIADSGPGSPGNETDYYGSLTEAALKRFQAKYGIVSSGTPASTGYGLLGPRTRAKFQELFGGEVPAGETLPTASIPTPAPSRSVSTPPVTRPTTDVSAAISRPKEFPRTLTRGMEGEDVTLLQTLLARDRFVYPDAALTGFYDAATELAVQRFQIKHNLVNFGSPESTGFGALGPRTAAKLLEALGP